MQKLKIKNLFLLFVFGFIFLPTFVFGATLYFKMAGNQYYLDDIFLVGIWLDTEGEEINAVEITINYPAQKLEAIDFSKGSSILAIWPREPDLSKKGEINLIGGVPNGFNGEGLIGKIVFRAISSDLAQVKFREDSKVLLNDGLGTLAKMNTKDIQFKVLAEKREKIKNEWQEELEKDKNPPEPFEIKIGKDPSVFDGKYFIAFLAFDKESGVDHYEVKEGEGDWKKAESPYLLEDQSLKSKIFVKAIDKAGNERISEIIPSSESNFKNRLPLIIFGLLVAGTVFWLVKKIRTKKLIIK